MPPHCTQRRDFTDPIQLFTILVEHFSLIPYNKELILLSDKNWTEEIVRLVLTGIETVQQCIKPVRPL